MKFPTNLKKTDRFDCVINTTQPPEFQYCLRCGKKLKSQEAKERGMGKICYEKSRRMKERSLF